ncbi:hypothetical protein KAR91_22935 [Candidatus Pacearchaeota archaeon]|nr:hypothetical protein [Candidatus Pacearchaeota archaeon]
MSIKLISDIRTKEARKEHAKLILKQILEKFDEDQVDMTAYQFSNIYDDQFISFTFKLGKYTIRLKVED